VDEAVSLILENTEKMETESVHYLDALNRISASDVIAREPLPPFAASVKDGYAIRLTREQREVVGGKENNENTKFVFEVIGAANAGDDLINFNLNEGQCVKINTGAPVPLMADAVIQIEDTIAVEKDSNGLEKKIQIVATTGCGGGEGHEKTHFLELKLGQDIRPIGFDIAIGETVVRKGQLIKPAQVGVCATVGALKLSVYKLPRVGLVSTGNELAKPDEINLKGGKIRDSNKSLLHAALKDFGVQGIFDAGVASDDANGVLNVFKNALENCEVVISTGGVSMGDKVLNLFLTRVD
jgi:gephyrin